MEDKLAAVEFQKNADQRCACVLLLDTSGSMEGEKIEELNNGLKTFKQELMDDDMARSRVDLAIITFDSEVKLVRDFSSPDDFEPPMLIAQYQTFMGTAILEALDRIEERKRQYNDNGIPYYRPWLFLITDGHPEGESEDVLDNAKGKLRRAQERKAVQVFAVGVGDQVDLDTIGGITGTNAIRLKGTNFKELFVWLSKSMAVVSSSKAGEGNIQLPVPGWGSIEA